MAYKNPQEFERTKADLLTWRAKEDAKKAATSAANKAHTVAKNSLSTFLRNEGLAPSSALATPDGTFSYTVGQSDKIKAREWYRMFKEKEITEEQFFNALTVNKDEAKDAIGADQVEAISETVAGKDAKVRFEKSDKPVEGRAEIVQTTPKRNAPVRPSVLTSNKPKPVEPAVQTSAKPGLRKITLKRNP